MLPRNSSFKLLLARNILDILDGDTDLGSIDSTGIKIAMPYLSGSDLCSISTKFGLPVTYSLQGGSKSRWQYLNDLIRHCIQNNKESELLSFLFSKGQFAEHLKGHPADVIDVAHAQIVQAVIEKINAELYFTDNELRIIGKRFVINEIGTATKAMTREIEILDGSYIASLSDRAMQDVSDGNYDSAITKSRTLLEEVFCHAIEKKGKIPPEKGDVNNLYSQVKDLYNMHQDTDMDKRIKTLLSGLEKILSAIREMRNKNSDAHGVGAKRINIAEHHARLFVNSAITMAEFILAVSNQKHE